MGVLLPESSMRWIAKRQMGLSRVGLHASVRAIMLCTCSSVCTHETMLNSVFGLQFWIVLTRPSCTVGVMQTRQCLYKILIEGTQSAVINTTHITATLNTSVSITCKKECVHYIKTMTRFKFRLPKRIILCS